MHYLLENQFRAPSASYKLEIGTNAVNGIAHRGAVPSTKRKDSNSPKFSLLLDVIEKILKNEAVSAVTAKNGDVFLEYKADSSRIIATNYNARTQTIASNIMASDKERWMTGVAAVFISAVSCFSSDAPNAKYFPETRKAFTDVVDDFEANSHTKVRNDLLAHLCDCFYYDSKDLIENEGLRDNVDTLPSAGDVLFDQLQQSCRRGYMTVPSEIFANHIQKSFSNFNFEEPLADSKSAATGEDFGVWFAKCKNGEFLIDYEWNDEQLACIPSLTFLDDYIPNATFRKLVISAFRRLNIALDRVKCGKDPVSAISQGRAYLNAIIAGRPGTGKSVTLKALAATLGLPLYIVNASKNTDDDIFEGKNKVIDGVIRFLETPFIKGFEYGGVIALEEFNLSDPAVMQGAIGQAIVPPFTLAKNGYDTVVRHPLCVIGGTMNVGTQGGRMPNQAFASRLPKTLKMDDPTEKEFISILSADGHDPKDCKRVYKAYKSILDYIISEEGEGESDTVMYVTLRHCLEALDSIREGFDFMESIEDTMIGAIALTNPELATATLESIKSKRL